MNCAVFCICHYIYIIINVMVLGWVESLHEVYHCKNEWVTLDGYYSCMTAVPLYATLQATDVLPL